MSWDKRGYYYRARKENGRVVREYIGTGEVARLCALKDTIDRQEREAERDRQRAIRAEMDALDEAVERFEELTDQLTRVTLQAAGFRQHKRGEWRKRRESNKGLDSR